MTRLYLKFEEAEQIIDFVKIINQYDYEADVKFGSRVVDAKSIVGVLSLARCKTVELILHTEDTGSLMEQIAPFAA